MVELQKLFKNYPELAASENSIKEAYHIICHSYDGGGKLLLCGNGGSAADCEHIASELLKGFKIKRPVDAETAQALRALGEEEEFINNLCGALPAIALTGPISYLTAFCNDNHPDFVFAQHLYALGKPGDVLLAISTSGNSKNVINAAKVARAKKIKVILLTGNKGGLLEEISDVCVLAPSGVTERVQEYHLPIYHTLCEMLEFHYWGRKESRYD